MKVKKSKTKKAITYKAETARINLSKNKHTATKDSVNYHFPRLAKTFSWMRLGVRGDN